MSHNALEDQAVALSERFEQSDTRELLAWALGQGKLGRLALVSSFGAEAAVLLHLVAKVNPATPVLFIDTLMLFPETLHYQKTLGQELGLRNIGTISAQNLREDDPNDDLHEVDPDLCCHLRKTRVLNDALRAFDGWISGRKRFQGGGRQTLALFEADAIGGTIKVNPLAHWTKDDVQAYFEKHRLPRHPLVARGYGSIGCAPCTIAADGRAGRWQGRAKTECGIHFPAPQGKLPAQSDRMTT